MADQKFLQRVVGSLPRGCLEKARQNPHVLLVHEKHRIGEAFHHVRDALACVYRLVHGIGDVVGVMRIAVTLPA